MNEAILLTPEVQRRIFAAAWEQATAETPPEVWSLPYDLLKYAQRLIPKYRPYSCYTLYFGDSSQTILASWPRSIFEGESSSQSYGVPLPIGDYTHPDGSRDTVLYVRDYAPQRAEGASNESGVTGQFAYLRNGALQTFGGVMSLPPASGGFSYQERTITEPWVLHEFDEAGIRAFTGPNGEPIPGYPTFERKVYSARNSDPPPDLDEDPASYYEVTVNELADIRGCEFGPFWYVLLAFGQPADDETVWEGVTQVEYELGPATGAPVSVNTPLQGIHARIFSGDAPFDTPANEFVYITDARTFDRGDKRVSSISFDQPVNFSANGKVAIPLFYDQAQWVFDYRVQKTTGAGTQLSLDISEAGLATIRYLPLASVGYQSGFIVYGGGERNSDLINAPYNISNDEYGYIPQRFEFSVGSAGNTGGSAEPIRIAEQIIISDIDDHPELKGLSVEFTDPFIKGIATKRPESPLAYSELDSPEVKADTSFVSGALFVDLSEFEDGGGGEFFTPPVLANPLAESFGPSQFFGLEWTAQFYTCDAFKTNMYDLETETTIEKTVAVAITDDEDGFKVRVSIDRVAQGVWPLGAFFPTTDPRNFRLTFLNGDSWPPEGAPALWPGYQFAHPGWPFRDVARLDPFRARLCNRQTDKLGTMFSAEAATCPVVLYLEDPEVPPDDTTETSP